MPHNPQTARSGAERARRLTELDAVLQQCRRLLQRAGYHDEGAMLLERIEQAQREVDRLRGLRPSRPVEPDTQEALAQQLAPWTQDLAGRIDHAEGEPK